MTIDNRLNFDSHISTVCNKVNSKFNVMLRFRNISQGTIFPTNYGTVLIMILSDVYKVSIRLISFHSFLSYFFVYFFLFSF